MSQSDSVWHCRTGTGVGPLRAMSANTSLITPKVVPIASFLVATPPTMSDVMESRSNRVWTE